MTQHSHWKKKILVVFCQILSNLSRFSPTWNAKARHCTKHPFTGPLWWCAVQIKEQAQYQYLQVLKAKVIPGREGIRVFGSYFLTSQWQMWNLETRKEFLSQDVSSSRERNGSISRLEKGLLVLVRSEWLLKLGAVIGKTRSHKSFFTYTYSIPVGWTGRGSVLGQASWRSLAQFTL